MSEYVKVNVIFKDGDALIAALKNIFPEVEVHDKAIPLMDYAGKIREDTKANIVVRRKHLNSASNDMGFENMGDHFRVHISDYDHGKDWTRLDRIKQEYSVEAATRACRRRGWSVKKEVREDGTVRLRVRGIK